MRGEVSSEPIVAPFDPVTPDYTPLHLNFLVASTPIIESWFQFP